MLCCEERTNFILKQYVSVVILPDLTWPHSVITESESPLFMSRPQLDATDNTFFYIYIFQQFWGFEKSQGLFQPLKIK